MRLDELRERLYGWLRRVRDELDPRSGVFPLERTGAVVGLALLVIVFAALSTSFRSPTNLIFLAKNVAITIGFVAIGQTIVMISGGIDLSVSSVIALTALVMASLMRHGLGFIPPLDGNLSYLAILLGWALGAAIGAGQGWLINRYEIPAFIVTLATMLGLRGITIGISGAIVYGLPTEFRWMSEGKVWFVPVPFLLMLLLYVVTGYMLRRTKIGRYCHAIGGNETAARLSGIDVGRYRVLFYAMSGVTAAITGTLLISNLNAAIYSHGEGYQFTSVAATVIGGTSLTGGVGRDLGHAARRVHPGDHPIGHDHAQRTAVVARRRHCGDHHPCRDHRRGSHAGATEGACPCGRTASRAAAGRSARRLPSRRRVGEAHAEG